MTCEDAPRKRGLGENPEPYGSFRCPRCEAETVDEYYGPCADCRAEVRRRFEPIKPVRVLGTYVTRQVWRQVDTRVTAFVDPVRGEAREGARRWSVSCRSAGDMLDGLPDDVRVVMLTRRPVVEWAELVEWAGHLGGRGWRADGHYLGDYDAPVFRFDRGGRKVDVRMAGAWFGDGADVDDAARAWAKVAKVIGDRFEGAGLMSSPGATGIELFARSIPPGVEYPTVSDEIAELIRSHSTQGRNELVRQGDEIGELVEYDCRWAYAALCGDMPTGPVERAKGDPGDAYDPYRPGWYRVRAIVPDDWTGLGIIPLCTDDGWVWPNRGGMVLDGWVSAVELALARKWEWECTIAESATFPTKVKPSPLDKWARRLQSARADVAGDELAARAVRAILLHGVGSFHAGPRRVTVSGPLDTAEPPDGALDTHIAGGELVWTEIRPPARPDMAHPEWSATVWAKCRARMLDGPGAGGRRTGALHVPPSHVVAMRTDALYLTADPEWVDDGKVGRLRHKRTLPGPFPRFESHEALLAVTRPKAGA